MFRGRAKSTARPYYMPEKKMISVLLQLENETN